MVLDKKFFKFIENRLNLGKPVQFQDLVYQFSMKPSESKSIMYQYYKETSSSDKVNYSLIILGIFKNGTIKVLQDLKNIPDAKDLSDCFIYAFNPTELFFPVNEMMDQLAFIGYKNPIALQVDESKQDSMNAANMNRSKTVEESRSTGASKFSLASSSSSNGVKRSKTSPEEKTISSTKDVKKKSTGLRSTELLAKMRKNREEKENQRQKELEKRKNEESAKKKEEMQKLNDLFMDDDEEDIEMKDADTNEKQEKPKKQLNEKEIEQAKRLNLDQDELIELVDTTAEESLLEIKKQSSQPQVIEEETTTAKKEEPIEESSFVDDDGYIVTKKPVSSTSSKRSTPVKNTAKPTPTKRRKQATLEGFFKRK